jgi:hypothetical protein
MMIDVENGEREQCDRSRFLCGGVKDGEVVWR